MNDVSDLVGKTMASVEQVGREEIVFTTTEGEKYRLYGGEDYGSSVRIEDAAGDLDDLIGSPITQAMESSNRSEPGGCSQTWTFYHFATVKGYVSLRWLGESNGYYSESVGFELVDEDV